MDTMLLLLYNGFFLQVLYRQLVLQGFNSFAFFYFFVMPLSEQYVISLFLFYLTPIYVYKEWGILIKY
jgi:hypothetical protein